MELILTGGLCFVIGFCLASLLGQRRGGGDDRLKDRRLRELERALEEQTKLTQERVRQAEQIRTFRHDFRHHLAVLRGYAQQGDLQAMDEYLAGFGILDLNRPMGLCANGAVDALLQRYLGGAQSEGIRLDAVLDLGQTPGITTPDLCAVFGNCLENAVEAVRRMPQDQREIRIRAKDTPGWLSLVLENTCPAGKLEQAGGGYRSAKEPGRVGQGLESIRALAEKYGGTAAFQMDQGRFRTSVILFKKDETHEAGDLYRSQGGGCPSADPSGAGEQGAVPDSGDRGV